MPIATRNGALVLSDGLLATDCRCCEPQLPNICEGSCPESLEEIAEDIVWVASEFRSDISADGFYSVCQDFGARSLFRRTDSDTCTFARMQEGHAVYTSNASLSQSLGMASVPVTADSGNLSMIAATETAQTGDRLIELCMPCNLAVSCVANSLYVKIRIIEAHTCIGDLVSRLAFANTNQFTSSRPVLTCAFLLCPTPFGSYTVSSMRSSFSGPAFPGSTGIFDLSIQPTPLP